MNSRRKRGGSIIGEGMQGIAFSPPLLCKNTQPNILKNNGRSSPFRKTRKTYVSKITKKNVANTEIYAAEQLRKSIDPFGRFTAPALVSCEASNIQTNANYKNRKNNINSRGLNTLVFSRYRGKTLESIFDEIDQYKLLDILLMLEALSNLLIDVAININGKSGVLHYDAHFRNIVYDSVTKDAALIDFGFARPVDPEIQKAIIEKRFDEIPPTLDIQKIHDEAILQFFMFGNSHPTSILLANPYINKWYAIAKNFRKTKPTFKDYLDSADNLKHSIIISELSFTDSEPDSE